MGIVNARLSPRSAILSFIVFRSMRRLCGFRSLKWINSIFRTYTKAYSRLGLVYYEQGEYGSALTAFDKGQYPHVMWFISFMPVLLTPTAKLLAAMHLDPENAAIKSNYEVNWRGRLPQGRRDYRRDRPFSPPQRRRDVTLSLLHRISSSSLSRPFSPLEP